MNWPVILSIFLLFSPKLASAAELNYQAPPVDNPMKGLVPYSGSSVGNQFPHSMEFGYIALNEIITGKNASGELSFQWASIESFLENAKKRGNQGILRIYSEYPDRGLSIPQFLIDEGLTITELLYDNHTAWTPDYDNPLLLQAFEAMIAALGAKYDGDERIAFLELGLIGSWGEWHNFGQPSHGAGKAVRGAVMQAYEHAFPTTKLLTRYPRGTGEGARANAKRRIGYHDDSFTWSTLGTDPWKFMQLMTEAEALEKWKTEAIGGELYPQLNPCVFESTCSYDGTEATQFLQTVEETHATYMRVEGVFRNDVAESRIQRAKTAVRRMGYDLHFSNATIRKSGDSLTIATTLENRGVAPFYYHWPMAVGLLDASNSMIEEWRAGWRIDGILPGTERVFGGTFTPADSLPKGAQIAVRVQNPMEGGRAVRFSNSSQQLSGQAWMILGAADGSPPPAPRK